MVGPLCRSNIKRGNGFEEPADHVLGELLVNREIAELVEVPLPGIPLSVVSPIGWALDSSAATGLGGQAHLAVSEPL